MSADNYIIIRKHPNGGYTPLNGCASIDGYPEVQPEQESFPTIDAACFDVKDEYTEYGISIHPECWEGNPPTILDHPMSERQLAIIRSPFIAIADDSDDEIAVFFTMKLDEGTSTQQHITCRDNRFPSLWEGMRGNILNLDGLPCWVDVSQQGLAVFMEVAKI